MGGDMGSPIFDSTFGTGRFEHKEPMTTDPTTSPSPEPQDVQDTFMQVLASLVAAVSLLKSGGKAAKKAAPSDKMFDQMILDYERAIEQGRAALAQSDAGQEPGNDFPDCIEKTLADLYTAPPRPDASGLIEAAEWHEKMATMLRASAHATREHRGDGGEIIKDEAEAEVHEVAAKHFRSRAADRSA